MNVVSLHSDVKSGMKEMSLILMTIVDLISEAKTMHFFIVGLQTSCSGIVSGE